MARDIATWALLRENVLGCLRASTSPMSVPEICGFSGVAGMGIHPESRLKQKVGDQVKSLLQQKLIERVERGQYIAAKFKMASDSPILSKAARTALKDDRHDTTQLAVTVDRTNRTVSFVFDGLQITVRIVN